MYSTCQLGGCNCAIFLRLCPHRGSFHCICFGPCALIGAGHGWARRPSFRPCGLLVLGHGLGSVASFICVLWHLSQLTAVHDPRVGDALGRIRPNKLVGL